MNQNGANILVVEDDRELREAVVDTLELDGCLVKSVDSAERAIASCKDQHFDMVVSDVNMGEMDGYQLLEQLQKTYPLMPVVLMTAYGSIERSVSAMQTGAKDYLVKPFEPQILVDCVKRHVSVESGSKSQSGPIVVQAESQQLFKLATRVAKSDSSVLICGESGTGKEVLARHIHDESPRKNGPFVAINCAAIPENMLEATLFGHEKGSFTGAHQSAAGKFEQADHGTLLLDEISEMDLGLQAKILRVLQEREVERIGGRKTIKLDLRVIATTNRDIKKEVAEGRFREDLYYRIGVFPLTCLPLRNRTADILPLANKFLESYCQKMGRSICHFSDSANNWLLSYSWPGNVRELENVVQRALILQEGNSINAVDLIVEENELASNLYEYTETVETDDAVDTDIKHLSNRVQNREFEVILQVLKTEGGNRKGTAEQLGISARTLRYKLAKMRDQGIDVETLAAV
ncbi:MAG: sigma-54 dependent transcriptional regulator [Pseudomonadales bacterium]|nr:sigma-54 dependent transcriptional regulator [Pseudomonadales bacterium]